MGSGAMDQLFLPSTPLKACSSQSFDESVDKYLMDPDDPRLCWQLFVSCTHYTYALYARK